MTPKPCKESSPPKKASFLSLPAETANLKHFIFPLTTLLYYGLNKKSQSVQHFLNFSPPVILLVFSFS